jgi:hypothetical protein
MRHLWRHRRVGAIAAGVIAGVAIGAWDMPTISATRAATVDRHAAFEATRATLAKPQDELISRLTGSYAVSGTDGDGNPYAGPGIVDIALAPSGALELNWNDGRQVGVAQVIGDILVAACLIKGRTAILIMTINADGSLSGRWSRRTDRGQKGTETWRKHLL